MNNTIKPLTGNQHFSMVNNRAKQQPRLEVGELTVNDLKMSHGTVDSTLAVGGLLSVKNLEAPTATFPTLNSSNATLQMIGTTGTGTFSNVVVNELAFEGGEHLSTLKHKFVQLWNHYIVNLDNSYHLVADTQYFLNATVITTSVLATMVHFNLPTTIKEDGARPGQTVQITTTGGLLATKAFYIRTSDDTPFRNSSWLVRPDGLGHEQTIFVVSAGVPNNTQYNKLLVSAGVDVNGGGGWGTQILCTLKADPDNINGVLRWEITCISAHQGTGVTQGASNFLV